MRSREMRLSALQKQNTLSAFQHIHIGENGTEIISDEKQNRLYIPTPTGNIAHANNAFVRLIMGPYGSGKSTWCVNEIVRRTCAMPNWNNGRRTARWAIVRNTSGELQSTTLQTWLNWFGSLGDIRKRQKPLLTYHHSFNDGKGIVELELIFLALDREEDLRKVKSLELTGVYLNELSEIPQGALSHFKGRVNGRYPSKSFCPEPYWSGIIADTNPPDVDHWIYKTFELEQLDSYKIFHQPPGLFKDKDGNWLRNTNADNANNLSDDYYIKLAEGQTEDFIKVFCLGEYGSVGFGKKVYPEYNDDVHCQEGIKAIQGEPIHLGWDFGLCYSDDTEVLTKDGWKFFKDVDEKVDLVATRNPINKEFEYTKINFKTEYDWNDELLEWASTEVNFCVTPEHRVPFTYRDTPDKVHFESAQWLADHHAGHHYVDLCSDWKPTFDESINYFGMSAYQYCQFMGLYLSEGCCDLNRITIYQNNQNPVMQEILNSTNRKWKFTGSSWQCGDPLLADHLKEFGKAKDKYVPQSIKDMPKNLIQAYIYAYTMGDGHIRKRKNGTIEHTLFTISKKMADDFQELAQKAGWNSSLRIVKPQISVIIEDGIEREIKNTGGYSICFKKRTKRAELFKRNFKSIQYNGKIYCLNVPYHTLYVRRNGKPSWNGNTPACVVVQMTPRGKLVVLKEYTSEDMGIKSFAENIVIPGLARDFPYNKIGISRADPSGLKSDEIMEELSCIGTLNSLGITTLGARTNDIDARIGSVRYFLNRMVDGKPGFIIDKFSCPVLRRGFVKDYQFKRLSVAGEERYREVPDKNMASHPHDSLQYIVMEFARELILEDKAPKEKVDMWNPGLRIF